MPSPSVDVHVQHVARLYEQTQLMVALFDRDDERRYSNPAFDQAFAVTPDQPTNWMGLMRRNYELGVGAAIQTSDIEAWLTSTQSRRGKLPFRAFETDLTDGRWIYMSETVDENGWMLCVAVDITAMRTNERSLRQARDGALRAAQTDTLTGISNRAHILQQLDRHLLRSRTAGAPCGVVMLDLDHFKRVNDTWGHDAGDKVLVHFVRLVSSTLRREDGFGRLGGEEFMLLFPNMDKPTLTQIVDRVLEMVRTSEPLPEVPGFSFTCSAGLSLLDPSLDAKKNIRMADQAVYRAKANGRDRLEWAT